MSQSATPDTRTSRTIDERMEEFVAVFGNVLRGARKLADYDARHHSDIWIQRLLGEGIACDYVIGYQLDEKWWMFCFERRQGSHADDEAWAVEAYDSDGGSWRGSFLYSPTLARWRRGPPEQGATADTMPARRSSWR